MDAEYIVGEYKKELLNLMNDVWSAIQEFDKNMPKSFNKGIHILEKGLNMSEEHIRILSYMEDSINFKPEQKKEDDNGKDNFKWLFDT